MILLCFCLLLSIVLFFFIVATPTVASSFISYPVTPLSSLDFSLTSPIAPILLPSLDVQRTNFNSLLVPSSIASVASLGSPCHGHLGKLFCDWMENIHTGTRAEDGLHGRDDLLLRISILITDGALRSERNIVSFSTKHERRSDVYLALPGCPPLVYVEEKALEGDLPVANKELNEKFCPLPHYERELDFIIGIAIAGNFVCFGQLSLAGGFHPLHTFNLNELSQRASCVTAAINVGRWALHAIQKQLVMPVPFPIGQKQTNPRRDITLLSEGIIKKKYKQLEEQQRDWLYKLYNYVQVGNKIRYFECATEITVDPSSSSQLSLTLRPFGVVASSRPPRTLPEFRTAIHCVLTCLTDLHAAGWAHLDIRWSNIVYMSPAEWVVIDAEFARPLKSPFPADLKTKDPEAIVADEQADCYMVGLLMIEHSRLWEQDKSAAELVSYLMAKGTRERNKRSAQGAIQSPFFRAV